MPGAVLFQDSALKWIGRQWLGRESPRPPPELMIPRRTHRTQQLGISLAVIYYSDRIPSQVTKEKRCLGQSLINTRLQLSRAPPAEAHGAAASFPQMNHDTAGEVSCTREAHQRSPVQWGWETQGPWFLGDRAASWSLAFGLHLPHAFLSHKKMKLKDRNLTLTLSMSQSLSICSHPSLNWKGFPV